MYKFILNYFYKWLVKYLSAPSFSRSKPTTNSIELLKKAIRPGDVLLVEGNQRFSTAVKYLTQSNWSHAALYVGDLPIDKYGTTECGVPNLVEADLKNGVRVLSIDFYGKYHTRICRPENLSQDDLRILIDYCLSKLGHSYDTKNILDLARYLIPQPPVPTKYKKHLLALGSGDPTKVICSSLIAEAFQKIHYPVLPVVYQKKNKTHFIKMSSSLFTPSDFDRSPYFRIIKPTLEAGFEYKKFNWSDREDDLD